MAKYYFVIEHINDRESGNTSFQTWIFESDNAGGPCDVWLKESLVAEAGRNPCGRAYETDEQSFCVGTIKILTRAEYNFLKEIGVKVMT